jgi:hypothetical protein
LLLAGDVTGVGADDAAAVAVACDDCFVAVDIVDDDDVVVGFVAVEERSSTDATSITTAPAFSAAKANKKRAPIKSDGFQTSKNETQIVVVVILCARLHLSRYTNASLI